MTGPRRIDHAQYSARLFSTDKELFEGTAARVSKAVKIEGVPQKQTPTQDKHYFVVHKPTEEAKILAKSILNRAMDNPAAVAACKRGIIVEVEKRDVKPEQQREYRTAINSEICRDSVTKALDKKLSLEDRIELLKFVDESKGQIDDATFDEMRGSVLKRFCEQAPTSDPKARQASVRALYASRDHFHLGNIHTIKDLEIRKMCEALDKEISQTLQGCIEHKCTPDFIDEYLGAMVDAVHFINSAAAYSEQAPEERKQVLQSANKILQGVLSPGKKGWFSKGVNFETAKREVALQKQRYDLMTTVATLKKESTEYTKECAGLIRSIRNAKTEKEFESINSEVQELILKIAESPGPTDSSSESDES